MRRYPSAYSTLTLLNLTTCFSFLACLLCFPNHAAIHKRQQHARFVYFGGGNLEQVAVEHDEIGQLAGNKRAFHVFGELRVGRADGESADGLIQSELLLG